MMFDNARLKLILWYTLILLFISGTLSMLFYLRTAAVLDRQFSLIEQRLQREQHRMIPLGSYTPRISPEELVEAKHKIIVQLATINGIISVVFATAGYFLSGKTLQPIREAMGRQKRFVADAAHELRTPITALKTSMEVNLMNKTLPQKARAILKENLEDLESLESLNESLLHLANQDELTLKVADVSVKKLVQRAVRHIEPLATEKGINLVVKEFPKSFCVKGDRELLLQMLLVFLDNAVKYSAKGDKITIEVARQPRDVLLRVIDTGIGIEKQHLPYIFERFYRVDTARGRQRDGGYGLGLALAKEIIEKHRGKVTAESVVGQGTTFTIKLPR